MRTNCALSLLLTAGLMLAQEAPPPAAAKSTGTVAGKVVNSTNGEPVRKVSVVLQRWNDGSGVSYSVQTDGNGRFLIDDVEPGEYVVVIKRQGFLFRPPGAANAPNPPLKLEKGQAVRDLSIPLTPLGVIAGRVVDEDGDPLRGASVSVLHSYYGAGKRRLWRTTADTTTTNVKGEFRLWGLRPGILYLSAVGPAYGESRYSTAVGQLPTYYPNSAGASHATPIELAAGAVMGGIDIRLRRVVVFTVRGKSAPGENPIHINLTPRDTSESSRGPKLEASQAFSFGGVLPGGYLIHGSRGEGGKRSYASQAVDVVNEDVDVGVLTFLPGVDVSGVVQTEGATALSPSLRITLIPDDGGLFAKRAEVNPDGSFLMHEVAPVVYQVIVNGTEPGVPGRDPDSELPDRARVYVKSMRMGNRDAEDGHVDLTRGGGQFALVLASDVGEVEGLARNGNGQPAARVRVTLVPQGGRAGRPDLLRSAFSNDQGEFKIVNVPPVEYKMFAWEDVPAGALQNAEFRKPFEKKGVAVKVGPNGHAKADVTVISVGEIQQAELAAKR
jgi:5-hydroxyisourate hydrolase-like protein (transthyretin family)